MGHDTGWGCDPGWGVTTNRTAVLRGDTGWGFDPEWGLAPARNVC
ncbi:hypothetical protein ACIGHB_29690 [Streptomyces sp. NPDC085460]